MANYEAISMNLVHADIRVTDGIYALLTSDEVKQRVACLTGQAPVHLPADGDLTEFLQNVQGAAMAVIGLGISNSMVAQVKKDDLAGDRGVGAERFRSLAEGAGSR